MSGVDVLAVMDRTKNVLLLCDPLVRSQMPPLMNSLEAQAFNARAEIDDARAAVAELIEADLEVDEAEAECAKYPGEGSSRWLTNAKARRVAALSRVRGAE